MEHQYSLQGHKKLHDLAVATMYLEKDLNIGGIIRTANAAAIKEVIIVGRKKFDWAGVTTARRKTHVIRLRTLDEFLDYADQKSYNLCALEISPKARNIFDFEYPNNPVIVVGSEGRGVPERLLERSALIKIPQYGNVECLNVATSLAIAIFDWIRKNATLSEKEIKDYRFTYKKEI